MLKNWGKQKGTWAELMYQESVAIISTMLRLKREHQIPSLSVHDSLIVPISKQKVAEELLSEEYFRVTKTRPQLGTSTVHPMERNEDAETNDSQRSHWKLLEHRKHP